MACVCVCVFLIIYRLHVEIDVPVNRFSLSPCVIYKCFHQAITHTAALIFGCSESINWWWRMLVKWMKAKPSVRPRPNGAAESQQKYIVLGCSNILDTKSKFDNVLNSIFSHLTPHSIKFLVIKIVLAED